jgi:hypothetical protein
VVVQIRRGDTGDDPVDVHGVAEKGAMQATPGAEVVLSLRCFLPWWACVTLAALAPALVTPAT